MADWYSNPNANLGKEWKNRNKSELLRNLVTANHILHHHGVVDAYGHVSIRSPADPKIYIMCGYLAPALVTSVDDLIEYWIDGSDPVNPNSKKGYAERFIHGEVFKKYPDVNCVVHSHAEAVLPYVCTSVPLKPVFHMAGFLGAEVPVFDIAKVYTAEDRHDMLVRNERLGSALADDFAKTQAKPLPDHGVVLMKRHGYTTWGTSIESAVYRAIYTKVNAAIQTESMSLQRNFGSANATEDVDILTGKMCNDCLIMNEGTMDKPWALWVKEVETNGLYKNLA